MIHRFWTLVLLAWEAIRERYSNSTPPTDPRDHEPKDWWQG